MSKDRLKNFGKEKNDYANLPQDPAYIKIPRGAAVDSRIDDTIEGIDEEVEHSKGKIRSNPSHQK